MTIATDTHATMEELLEIVFCFGFVLRLYTGSRNQWFGKQEDKVEVSAQ
jgi:hypothetical protein